MIIVLSSLFIIMACWSVSLNYNTVVMATTLLLTLFYIKSPFPLNKEALFVAIAFLLFFVSMLAMNITVYDDVDYEKIDIYKKKILFLYPFFVLTLILFINRKDILLKSINISLLVFALIWFFQFFIYYITGEYIDFLKPFNGVEQRYQAYFMKIDVGLDIIRPTSIFNEPGTYAMITLPLLILSYIDKRKFTKTHILVLVSFFLSLSLFAIISAILFILIIFVSKLEFNISKKNIIIIFTFAILGIIMFIGIQSYLELRFVNQNNTGALDLRGNIIDYWLSLDSKGILLGQGFAQSIFPYAVVDDTSFAFKIIYEFGILSLPLFILMIYISWGFPIFMLFLILLTKMSYMHYIFWFYFAALFIINKRDKELNK